MKNENVALMKMARQSLEGKWSLAMGGFAVYFLFFALLQSIPKVGPIVWMFIAGPLEGGLAIFFLAISRKQEPKIEQLFQGFDNFGTLLGAYWLKILYVLLWSLLLIVPGIIASLSYSMTFFIIADDTSIGISEALRKSKAMMHGKKWKLFCFHWRFFGWFLLSLLLAGIGFLWLFPYMQVGLAKFYEDLRDEDLKKMDSSDLLSSK